MSAAIRFPHASPPPRATTTLNLDIHGQPLTYKNAKAGPDRERWTTAEIVELCRLIDSRTLFALPYNAIPKDRRSDVVYYNPVVKQKIKDDKIQFRVRGTAGGNLLSVPYNVSARTADLDVVKLLIHSIISSDKQWMTIDIKDYYLGTPLPASRYEYIRIPLCMVPAAVLDRYNLHPYITHGHVYFEIRKCMYGLPQAGKLSQLRLIDHLSQHGFTHSMPQHPVPIPTFHPRHHLLPGGRRLRSPLRD